MTTLCPTCNNTLDRKHVNVIGEEMLRCRVCRKYSVEDVAEWLSYETYTKPDFDRLRKLIKQRDDDRARQQLMMETPIDHPIWTRVYL